MSDKPDTQELETYAAVEIIHLLYEKFDIDDNHFMERYITAPEFEFYCHLRDWHPVEDANQLDLIQAELVKLGCGMDINHNKEIYFLMIISPCRQLALATHQIKKPTKDKIHLTRLTVMCEAHRKLKQND